MQKVIDWDYHLLEHVSKKTLLCAAILMIAIGVLRRCTLVGVIASVGFGSAVLGAEFLKKTFPWHALIDYDSLLPREFKHGTYPSGHATIGTSLALGLLMVALVPMATMVSCRCGLLQRNVFNRRSVRRLASAI